MANRKAELEVQLQKAEEAENWDVAGKFS